MTFLLKRVFQNDKLTQGVLIDDDGVFATTIERPWLNNQNNISCVPAGIYECVRYHSPKHDMDVFMLTNVPGREVIEIHIANIPADLLGCIGIGSGFGTIGNQRGVIGSAVAFHSFMMRMDGVDKFTLRIVEV